MRHDFVRSLPSGTIPALMIIYIHGFNSSPSSHKARLLGARLAALGRADEFACPALPHQPADAMALLEKLLATAPAVDSTPSAKTLLKTTLLCTRRLLRKPCEVGRIRARRQPS